ncbi:hypothetical protein HYPSUDRAFT_133486 [Hypholoma sublateritium FD-334 SS-4]|uniref:AB hydrolase-1 domain-containing protein n=1 Tax=Hypholoma sublateritium (strain FD-334 SS-4) TaxID=945553 RepID=A0A0D2LF22_HYPSF|nr:hypothetical protein HYPSUDRAFT_133486 [Hypholoma sublateritium FD-334 SS-4]
MQSILQRHNSSAQRTPRKSSSFLSLRREKDKPEAGPSAYDTAPSSYFEVYPKAAHSLRSRMRRSPSATQAPAPPPPDAQYAFPSLDDDFAPPAPHAHGYTRTRSRTGPSKWDAPPAVPHLRFSHSSSTQHTETPPRTPDDYTTSTDSLDLFPVVVAAPIPGVETMDALVDGMNGGGGDPSFSRRPATRARFGIPGHHPLYQPPLPTPPPGVVLGGPTKSRTQKIPRRASPSSDSSEDEGPAQPPSRSRRRRPRPARSTSNSTIIPPSISRISLDETAPGPREQIRPAPQTFPRRASPGAMENRKSVVPSISEIIRNHAPPEAHVRSRPPTIRSSSLYSPSTHGHATVHEEPEPEPEPPREEEDDDETEFVSRSSIDSVADEVQRTIRNQLRAKPALPPPPPPQPAPAFLRRQSVLSDNASSIYSPRSDPGAAPSLYSVSAPSSYLPPSPLESTLATAKPPPALAVAQYLRSARLTTLLRLTRSPHASQDNPLVVSLSDLGSPTGVPVVVFLGLGCVRHIMGLYDEMAECMGLRLITIDRWGLGRTEPRSKSAKGIMQWASVVEEVLDLLHIDQCSIMAHSAGAPYALSFANKLPARIRGDVCLLAPWVGGSESSGYKWLKYVPNGILKTAQAAEWKLQAWMIGKPPTIAYEGIGYTAPPAPKPTPDASSTASRKGASAHGHAVYQHAEARPRPSTGSKSTFSEYDDLNDFDGRFESRSTLGLKGRPASQHGHGASGVNEHGAYVAKRKTSRGILGRLKGASGTPSPPPPPSSQDRERERERQGSGAGKKLKGLRSMGSLKARGKDKDRDPPKSEPASPQLPAPLRIDVGLGLEDLAWMGASIDAEPSPPTATPYAYAGSSVGSSARSGGRRSISFTSSKAPAHPPPPPLPASSMPSSPSPSTFTTSFAQGGSSGGGGGVDSSRGHQIALGNALIAASHAESAKGTHNDLLQILNHEGHSWGFAYAAYPHRVRIWYGDRDERIAEDAVRWMERTMGPERCSVKVVRGADHGLMYRSSAVVDVLEWIASAWRPEERRAQPYAGLR